MSRSVAQVVHQASREGGFPGIEDGPGWSFGELILAAAWRGGGGEEADAFAAHVCAVKAVLSDF